MSKTEKEYIGFIGPKHLVKAHYSEYIVKETMSIMSEVISTMPETHPLVGMAPEVLNNLTPMLRKETEDHFDERIDRAPLLKLELPQQKVKQKATKTPAPKPKKVNSLRSALKKAGVAAEVTEAPTGKPTVDTETVIQPDKQSESTNKSKHQGKAKTFRRKTKRSGRV